MSLQRDKFQLTNAIGQQLLHENSRVFATEHRWLPNPNGLPLKADLSFGNHAVVALLSCDTDHAKTACKVWFPLITERSQTIFRAFQHAFPETTKRYEFHLF
jgi:hypothetical protein